MDFQRATGPIGDPFLDTVHRRRPDVDIVVLPEPGPSPEPLAVLPADADTARAEREDTGARLLALWRLLHDAPDADPHPVRARLAPGRAAGTVVATALATATVATESPDGRRMLARLRDGLDGWHIERIPGPVERLLAERDGAAVRASYAESTGVLVLELTGPPLAVGAEVAHVLVGEG